MAWDPDRTQDAMRCLGKLHRALLDWNVKSVCGRMGKSVGDDGSKATILCIGCKAEEQYGVGNRV